MTRYANHVRRALQEESKVPRPRGEQTTDIAIDLNLLENMQSDEDKAFNEGSNGQSYINNEDNNGYSSDGMANMENNEENENINESQLEQGKHEEVLDLDLDFQRLPVHVHFNTNDHTLLRQHIFVHVSYMYFSDDLKTNKLYTFPIHPSPHNSMRVAMEPPPPPPPFILYYTAKE